MRCIAQKAIRAGNVVAHLFYILCTKLNFSREPENSKRRRHLLQETDISTSRPTFTRSKSSLHTPDPGDSERKRAGSPSPGTSKQRREVTSAASSTSGGDARGSGGDETRRMQHEISMGFDRLIAKASDVDKRRKSAENSPVQDGTSPRKSASDLRLPESQDSMAQKFKVSQKNQPQCIKKTKI